MSKILIKLEEMNKVLTEVRVKTAKIEEHLSNLNGTVARHESCIGELYTENKQQSMSIAKIMGFGIGCGGLGGIITALVTNLI